MQAFCAHGFYSYNSFPPLDFIPHPSFLARFISRRLRKMKLSCLTWFNQELSALLVSEHWMGLLNFRWSGRAGVCSVLCFIYSPEAWSSVGLCTTSIPNKNEPQLHSWDSVGGNHKGSWECPTPSTWGDLNKIDAAKARLTIWESQAVPRKRYLSWWSVDIIKKANASHFNGYLSLAASFQGQPHFVLFTFCVYFVYFFFFPIAKASSKENEAPFSTSK